MDEEQFNMELRKFLKRFGVSAQREIEKVVQQRREAGVGAGAATLHVRARLEIEGGESDLVIEEDLPLA
jgi:hypothetical protein